MYTCIYVGMYVCMCINKHIYIYTHVYLSTPSGGTTCLTLLV